MPCVPDTGRQCRTTALDCRTRPAARATGPLPLALLTLISLAPLPTEAVDVDTRDIAPDQPIDAAAMVTRFQNLSSAVTALESPPLVQLVGPAQAFPGDAWTPITFSEMTVTRGGVDFNGDEILLPRAGVWRITVSLREAGEAPNNWTSVRAVQGGETVGMGVAAGTIGPDNPMTWYFLAEVPAADVPVSLEFGRDTNSFTVPPPGAIAGATLPAIVATLEFAGD